MWCSLGRHLRIGVVYVQVYILWLSFCFHDFILLADVDFTVQAPHQALGQRYGDHADHKGNKA